MKTIPWLRIVLEGTVIVGSILLAFAIDALWNERQEHELERIAYASLESEFTENRRRLDETKRGHIEARSASIQMLRLIAEDGAPAGSYQIPDSVSYSLGGYEAFDPARGALTSLLNSGSLLLIRDDTLRMALSAWPDALDDLALREEVVRDVNESWVVPILHEHIPYVTIDFLRGEAGFEQASPFTADTKGLLESLPFENWLDLQVLRLNDLLEDYDQRLAEADFILRRLDLTRE